MWIRGRGTRALILLCAVVTLALLCLPAISLAEDASEYAVVNNPRAQDRLNLRAEQSTGAASMGKYYNGVAVRVIYRDYNTGWTMVNIGGIQGYMHSDYLAFGEAAYSVTSAMPIVQVANPRATDRLNLRFAPSVNSASLNKYSNGTSVLVLGVLDAGWYHVIVDDQYGYMQSQYLTAIPGSGGGDSAVVNNPKSTDRLHLRATLPQDGKLGASLGKYYNGVKVSILGYDSSGEWVKVMVGNTMGYMRVKYLAVGTAGDLVQSVIPVKMVNNPDPASRLNLRALPSSTSASLDKYYNGTWVEILGVLDTGWYHVRVSGKTGYMMAKYLK